MTIIKLFNLNTKYRENMSICESEYRFMNSRAKLLYGYFKTYYKGGLRELGEW